MNVVYVGGEKYEVDVDQVTLKDWDDLVRSVEVQDKNASAFFIMRIMRKTLGEQMNHIPLRVFPYLTPKVLELLVSTANPITEETSPDNDIETELEEILRRFGNN